MNNDDFTFKVRKAKTKVHEKDVWSIELLYKNVRIDDKLAYEEEVEEFKEKLKKQYFGKISKSVVIDNGSYSTLIFQWTFEKEDVDGNTSLEEEVRTIKFYNYNGEAYILYSNFCNSLMVGDINEVYKTEKERAEKEHLDYLPLNWVFGLDKYDTDVVVHMLENNQIQSIFGVIKESLACEKETSIKEKIKWQKVRWRFYISPTFVLTLTENENELGVDYLVDHWLNQTGITVKFDTDIDNLTEDELAEGILEAIVSKKDAMKNLFNYMWRLEHTDGHIEDSYPNLKNVPLYNPGERKNRAK